MKKIAVTTAIIVASTIMVNAQIKPVMHAKGDLREKALRSMGTSTRPMMSTSTKTSMPNDAIGQQVMALNKEMESKIKAIRDEYQLKIKAIVGNSTSTYQMMKDREDQKNENENHPVHSANGSTTENQEGDMMPMPRMRLDGEVKGESVGAGVQAGGFTKFFKGLFGAN